MNKLFEHFIENGNLRTFYQWLFATLGVFLLLLPAMIEVGEKLKFLSISIGAVIGAIGGYAARASVLKIRPFDNSYRKARESYKKDDSKN